jgi:hypothetical protein
MRNYVDVVNAATAEKHNPAFFSSSALPDSALFPLETYLFLEENCDSGLVRSWSRLIRSSVQAAVGCWA